MIRRRFFIIFYFLEQSIRREYKKQKIYKKKRILYRVQYENRRYVVLSVINIEYDSVRYSTVHSRAEWIKSIYQCRTGVRHLFIS